MGKEQTFFIHYDRRRVKRHNDLSFAEIFIFSFAEIFIPSKTCSLLMVATFKVNFYCRVNFASVTHLCLTRFTCINKIQEIV